MLSNQRMSHQSQKYIAVANKCCFIQVVSFHRVITEQYLRPETKRYSIFVARLPQRPDMWSRFQHLFERLEIPARVTLLEEGKVARKMFFIEKGCLRTWVNANGKDITTQFFFEGQKVSSIESFRTKQPSLYSIESIEPCILRAISEKDFKSALESSPELQRELEAHLFKRLLQSQQHFFSYLRNNPQQRYEELVQQHPEIILRVPQHYIASYLGITPVSLSRIRNRR
jgi:CRP-like cAMP-binding protein